MYYSNGKPLNRVSSGCGCGCGSTRSKNQAAAPIYEMVRRKKERTKDARMDGEVKKKWLTMRWRTSVFVEPAVTCCCSGNWERRRRRSEEKYITKIYQKTYLVVVVVVIAAAFF